MTIRKTVFKFVKFFKYISHYLFYKFVILVFENFDFI